MERESKTVTIDEHEYEDLMTQASMLRAMYQDLQSTVRLWERLRENQLHLLEQCESIESARDAVPVIRAVMVVLRDCIHDIERILRRYAAAGPVQRFEGGEADADRSLRAG